MNEATHVLSSPVLSSPVFKFPGAEGGKLSGRLDLPNGTIQTYALFAHCFTCTKDIFVANQISSALVKLGIGVLRFDFSGLGSSEGEFANSNFSSNVADLVAAADHMAKNNMAPQILIGHSLGGAAILACADQIPQSRAVVSIGAPSDPAHVKHIFQNSIEEINQSGEAKVLLAGRPFCIKKQFLDDIEDQKLLEKVSNLKKALLIMHAPLDKVVGIENASEIFLAAKHPKSFVSLDDSDHFLSKRADAIYGAEIIGAWAQRYIQSETAGFDEPEAVEGSVAVAETGTGKFSNVVVTGSGHILSADEPKRVGGDDSGPTPYDFLLAALGTCKSMTMRMYATRKGYDLERVQVRLSHEKTHAKDCEQCETENGKVDVIDTKISITGNLSEEEKKKIFEIAERCPVHRTITSKVHIKAQLQDIID